MADDIMLYGQVGYDHNGNKEIKDRYSVGVGGRYYIEQNGIYLGANCKLVHKGKKFNDVMPGVEVGYATLREQRGYGRASDILRTVV